MYNTSSDLGEFNGSDMNRLDEQLAIFSSFVKVCLLCPLQLFLQKEYDLFNIPARCHAENYANCLAANIQISTEKQSDQHKQGIGEHNSTSQEFVEYP